MIRVLFGCAVACVAACGGGDRVKPVGAQVGPALVAALEATHSAKLPWRCAAPDGPELASETLAVGEDTWKLAGHTLALDAKPQRGSIVIGAIADAGGAAPRTIAALGRLRTKLARADLVLALGGMGGTQGELEATLGALAERSSHPVVALPGDLEAAGELSGAVAALRERGLPVIDGRLVRRIEIPGATIALVPGGAMASRLVAGAEGCAYRTTDVHDTFEDLSQRAGLRILASADAPRITVDGEPSGELALSPNPGREIDIVLHGPTSGRSTRARTGTRDGSGVALTPGTADATLRLPGPLRAPTAGLLTTSRTSWSWKPVADTE